MVRLKPLPARLTERQIAEVKRLADIEQISESEWIRNAVKSAIDRENRAQKSYAGAAIATP